jgi:hypothetical protein
MTTSTYVPDEYALTLAGDVSVLASSIGTQLK